MLKQIENGKKQKKEEKEKEPKKEEELKEENDLLSANIEDSIIDEVIWIKNMRCHNHLYLD